MRFEKDWGRLGLKFEELSQVSSYVSERIRIDEVNLDNYVSTENMISERGGVTKATKLPSGKTISVFQKGDILISNIRPYFKKIWLADKSGGCSNDVLVVRANEKISNRFLYYVLSSDNFFDYAVGTSKGTKMPRGDKKAIMKYKVPIYSLVEQEKIAEILRAFDKKVILNKQINHHLEQMAQAIFKSWFVDFEPFGGVKPFDWQEGVFSEIVSSTLSGDWGKENPMGNYQKMVYCMRGADLPEITFGNKGKMPVRYISPKNFTNKQLTANNIVIEISGGSPTQSTGRCALITQSLLDRYECDMVCTNFCRAIKPKEGYSEFIYYYWRYLYEHNIMFLYENGTTGIKNLDISSFLENEKIIIPTLNSVHKFSNIVQKLRNTIATNGLEIEKLTNLRDTLLPKLLSGEISVNQATK